MSVMRRAQARAGKVKVEQIAFAFLVVVAVAIGVFVVNRLLENDVKACRRIFTALAHGNPKIRESIDWEHLKMLDTDIGESYKNLPNLYEKSLYQVVFIQHFAEGFRQGGADVKYFTNWRQQGDGVVAADYPSQSKTLRFQLSPGEPRQLRGLQWQ
jgi:hypothetical protein